MFGFRVSSGCLVARDPADQYEEPLEPELDPAVEDAPPWSETITNYDVAHLVTYLRLLDAARDGVDWTEAAQIILRLAPDDPRARPCWEAHRRRAEWMTHAGYQKLLDRAGR